MINAVRYLVLGVAISSIFGCASVAVDNAPRVTAALKGVKDNNKHETRVDVVEEPYIRATRIPYKAPSAVQMDLVADGLALKSALNVAAERGNISLSYADDIDRARKVSVVLRDVTPEAAIRDIAFAAGYVAIFESPTKVIVGTRGTMTFKLPTRVLDALQARYDVANNPEASSGGSSGGGGGSGSQGGQGGSAGSTSGIQQTRANANVKGAVNSSFEGVLAYLRGAIGEGVSISVLPASGMLTVRGDGIQLRRARQMLDRLARNATAQVDVRLAVVEVGLTAENQFGIDWTKVVPMGRLLPTGAARVAFNTARITDPALTATIATDSISSVIQALAQRTAVRVVKQPQVRAMNNAMAILRTGTQEPILASLKSDVSGTSGTVTTTATFQYVQDGESLAVIPNIIDSDTVELTIIPTFSNISAFREFTVGNTIARLPATPLTEGAINLVSGNNQTLIIGGTRIDSTTKDVRGLPGLADIPVVSELLSGTRANDNSREVVLLVHTVIHPSTIGAQLVAESL